MQQNKLPGWILILVFFMGGVAVLYIECDKLAQEKKQRIVEKKIASLIHYFKNNGNVELLFMNQVLNCSIAVPAVGYSSGPWFQITCLLNSDML